MGTRKGKKVANEEANEEAAIRPEPSDIVEDQPPEAGVNTVEEDEEDPSYVVNIFLLKEISIQTLKSSVYTTISSMYHTTAFSYLCLDLRQRLTLLTPDHVRSH